MFITRTHNTIRATAPRILLAILLAATSTAACAAKSKKSPPPKDPAALLALAAQHNGLTSPNLKPWHIKATYQLYDTKGNPTEKGTFNEWWAAPNKYKITFDRTNFHYELYVTPNRAYFSKNAILQVSELDLLHWLIAPVPDPQLLKGFTIKQVTEKSGQAQFNCLVVAPPAKHKHTFEPQPRMYCLSPDKPILQFVEARNPMNPKLPTGVVYTSIGKLQGRYIGLDLHVGSRKQPEVTAHVDSGEVLTHPSDAIFTPPPAELPHLEQVHATAKNAPFLTPPMQLPGKPYNLNPYLAEILKGHEEVIAHGIIGIDGTLHHLKVVSSQSTILKQYALQAMHTWRFRPCKLSGIPIPVSLVIEMNFSFGDKIRRHKR